MIAHPPSLKVIVDPGSAVPIISVSPSSIEFIVGVSLSVAGSNTVVPVGSDSLPASSVAVASISSSSVAAVARVHE